MEFKDVPEVLDKLLDRVSVLEAGYSPVLDAYSTLPPVLTTKDLMSYLQCSMPMANQIMHDPKLKAFRIGALYRVTKDNFINWMNLGGSKECKEENA